MGDKRPSADRIAFVGKKWVSDFIEFFALEDKIRDRQTEEWCLALADFNDQVLEEGWGEFLGEFKPGFIPRIKDATRIFSRASLRVSFAKETRDRKKKALEVERFQKRDAGDKKKISVAVNKALNLSYTSENPNKDVNLYLADFWETEMNNRDMARRHRLLIKE